VHEECEKKKRKKCDMKKHEEATEEKWELEAAKVQVAQYEAEAKVRVEVGELIGGSDASLDTEVALVGVESKLSDNGVFAPWLDLFAR